MLYINSFRHTYIEINHIIGKSYYKYKYWYKNKIGFNDRIFYLFEMGRLLWFQEIYILISKIKIKRNIPSPNSLIIYEFQIISKNVENYIFYLVNYLIKRAFIYLLVSKKIRLK
jgi:hypothetical protein